MTMYIYCVWSTQIYLYWKWQCTYIVYLLTLFSILPYTRGKGTEGEPRCSCMVSSSCSTGATINVSCIRLTSIFGTCKLNGKHHTSIVADLSVEYLKTDSKEDRFCPFQLNLAFVLYFWHCRINIVGKKYNSFALTANQIRKAY
jgi:hypothetical protein